MDALPTELLCFVFSYLEDFRDRLRAEMVCKRWRDISRNEPWNPQTQTEIIPNYFYGGPVTERLRVHLQVHGSRIPCLLFHYDDDSNRGRFEEEWILRCTASCPNLTELVFHLTYNNPMTDDTLTKISRTCQKLEVVSLNGLFSDRGVEALLNCPIRKMHLEHSNFFSGLGLRSPKKNLQELGLNYLKNLSFFESSPVWENLLSLTFESCEDVATLARILELTGTSMISLKVWSTTFSELLPAGFGHCKSLENLDVNFNDNNDNILAAVAISCSNLSWLKVRCADRLSSSGFNSIVQCKSLVKLVAVSESDSSVIFSEEYFTALSRSESLKDVVIRFDSVNANGIPSLLSCDTLQRLKIRTHLSNNISEFGDAEQFGFSCNLKREGDTYGTYIFVRNA